MNRVHSICPQCKGKGCTDIACKFSGIKHEAMDKINASIKLAKVAAPQENRSDALRQEGANVMPACAAPIGYEAAWINPEAA